MTTIRALCATALLPLLFACSEASFTGGANQRATQPDPQPSPEPTPLPPTPEGEAQLGCAVDPGEAKVGAAAQVVVSAKEPSETLYQTVILGETRSESILKLGGPETRGLYSRDDGTANEIRGEVQGTLTVELRKSKDSAQADATCQLTVTDTPVIVNPTPVPTPVCEDSERKIGAEIAFLIDNSNSNAATDCPNDRFVRKEDGVDIYECQSETNREKAVLTAYDVLRAVADSEPGNEWARSRLAIGSFPTSSYTGWANQTQGFVDVGATERAQISQAMAFSRKPFGMTPYDAALGGAQGFFAGSTDVKRAKIAVLVTDGEPTDQSPAGVVAKAQALAAGGVKVITVFVTSGATRSARETKHIAMLQDIETRWYSSPRRVHWYDARYPSFGAYTEALLGSADQGGVIRTISDKIIEVQDSASLKDAFLHIIKNEAITCEP